MGAVDPNDPRLLVGSFGTTYALDRVSAELGSTYRLLPNLLPTDLHLRALVGLFNPWRHLNATEIVASDRPVVDLLISPGFYLDAGQLLQHLRDQGGYAPTPETAYDDDQVFMYWIGIEAILPFLSSRSRELLSASFLRAVDDWLLAQRQDPVSTPSFAEWIRTMGALD